MATLAISDFLREHHSETTVTVDVRTPSEFAHAHIPGAVNLPLFDDDERAVVGTTYKEDGRHEAIKVGLDLVGPKMRSLVERVGELAGPPGARTVLVHCWRGGMRSRSVAWLLGLYGWEVSTLEGGYKSFRRWVLDRLEELPPLLVLGGRTGSRKTEILAELAGRGASVIDLEGLANHRGSAFGALQMPDQPSQEQFEALVALALDALPADAERVWIEDESRMIGVRKVPDTLMKAMRASPVIALEVEFEARVEHLVETYGEASIDDLAASFERIRKRLGPDRSSSAMEALAAGDLETAVRVALDYYDRAYDYGLSRRDEARVHWIAVESADAVERVEAFSQEIGCGADSGDVDGR